MSTHTSTEDTLDAKSRARLEKLAEEWDKKSPASLFGGGISGFDLKLLLEHFAPLQDTIRALVAIPAGVAPGALAHETSALRAQVSAVQATQSTVENALTKAQAELAKAHDQCRVLQRDLGECAAATQALLQDKKEHEQASRQLDKKLQLAQKELKASQAELTRAGSAPMELALLRDDTALAQALGLSPLPTDDTQALIQTVAVLAQRDNLERLWSALKDRCETDRRPANASEGALLAAALAWHNYNWRTRPYRLIEAAPTAAYDFERHLRSRHANTGETVAAQHLPGIADGSGTPLCKALVSTR
ncbi:MAG: hypothetical protein ACWA6Y_04640 [Polaromonas sp.]